MKDLFLQRKKTSISLQITTLLFILLSGGAHHVGNRLDRTQGNQTTSSASIIAAAAAKGSRGHHHGKLSRDSSTKYFGNQKAQGHCLKLAHTGIGILFHLIMLSVRHERVG